MPQRKVKILEWQVAKDENGYFKKDKTGKSYNEKIEVGTGLFHQWGLEVNEASGDLDGWTVASHSTAIVEMEDGTIQNVHCEMIQFIK